MKKIAIALLIAAGLGWTSCEDFLDTASPSEFTHDVVFSSVAYAEYAITGIYNDLVEDGLYSARLPLNFSTNTDIEFVGADVNSYQNAGNRGYSNYFAKPEDSHLNDTWTKLFRVVERSNLAIEGIRGSALLNSSERETRQRMEALLAEALTLRSLAYSELIKHFGDVPFKQESTKADGSNIYLPVTDRDLIYDAILADLQEADDLSSWVGQLGYTSERITKGFIKGLTARIALYRGGYSIRNKDGFPMERGSNWEEYYQLANEMCREIVEEGVHQMNPSYENVWRSLNSRTLETAFNENMFEVALGLSQHGEMGYSIGVRFSRNPKYGYGNNSNVVNTSAYYLYSFGQTDLRRDVSVAYYTYGNNEEPKEFFQSNPMGFNFQKWDQRWMGDEWLTRNMAANNKWGYGINWVLMRYPDVLLMLAETENALNGGPTQIGSDALKQVRKRAFPAEDRPLMVDAYVDALSNEDAFFNAIVDERAWEFGGEGLRKYDLIRWNLLDDKIQEQRNVMAEMLMYGQHPKHGQLPERVLYKYEDNGEVIDRSSINFYENLGSDQDPEFMETYGYVDWFSNSDPSGWLERAYVFSTGLSMNAAGVSNRHLFPIPLNVISESQGKIEQHLGY